MALIYYTQDFRVYEGTRDQPMPGPFPAPPIFWGKSPGDEIEPMVLVQKWPFFQLFFLGHIALENVIYDILERQNVFLSYKNKKFKKSKNWHFSKGVNPWFWSKNGHFSNFFF